MPPIVWVSTLTALSLYSPVAAAGTTTDAPTGNYEVLASGSVRTQDVATLLAPFVDHCDDEKRDLDRVRCRAVLGYLRSTLPEQTFALASQDPGTIAVSDYDAGIKGYHVALAGCVACARPLAIGRRGDLRFVTVKAPDRHSGDTLVKAVGVAQTTFAFDSLPEAKRWLDAERPFLQAEFLFQPRAANADWTFGASHGVALKLLGARIYNRCTGQVLLSTPPSTGSAERAGAREPACRAIAEASHPPVNPAAELPAELGTAEISAAMATIRPQIFACYKKFHAPGRLELTYVVAGNGTVQSVVMGPSFAGTSTGLCVLEAAKDARFVPFQLERQRFSYPFFLRD